MDRIYKLSRIFLALLVVFVMVMWCIHGATLSFFLILAISFGVITYLVSFLTSRISKKIISKGNETENIFLKIIYYIVILIVGCLGFALNYLATEKFMLHNKGFYIPIDKLIIDGAIIIGIILPWVQTIIVLILKCFIKDKK